MAALSTTTSNQILDKEFGATNYTPPANHYLALYSTAPNSDGTGGTELALSGGYARIAIANNTTSWSTASAKSKRNAIALAFPQATANWTTAVAAVLLDASSGGAIRAWGVLDPVVTVTVGQTRSFAINELEIKIT